MEQQVNSLLLVALTPRAGNLGHRILVPSSVHLDEERINRVLDAAATAPEGETYLSVSTSVPQRLSTGSIRQGTEWLVLSGTQIARLNDEQKLNLYRILRARLMVDLERLVTKSIDWSKETGHLFVARQELNTWLDEARQIADFQVLSGVKGHSREGKTQIFALAWVMVALVVFGGAAGWLFWPDTEEVPQTFDETMITAKLQEDLAKECNLNSLDATAALEPLRTYENFRAFLLDYATAGRPSFDAFVFDESGRRTYTLLLSDLLRDAKEACNMRRALHETGNTLWQLVSSAKRLSPLRKDEGPILYKAQRRFADFDLNSLTTMRNDPRWHVVSPFFTDHELLLVRIIHDEILPMTNDLLNTTQMSAAFERQASRGNQASNYEDFIVNIQKLMNNIRRERISTSGRLYSQNSEVVIAFYASLESTLYYINAYLEKLKQSKIFKNVTKE